MGNGKFDLPKTLTNDYRDLCMLRDAMRGMSMHEISLVWGCTVRTANNHVKAMASDMMRAVFVATQGDTEHPATPRWTIEEFTSDPRGCLIAMTETHIGNIERQYPRIKKGE